jgi:hypothetical protein
LEGWSLESFFASSMRLAASSWAMVAVVGV